MSVQLRLPPNLAPPLLLLYPSSSTSPAAISSAHSHPPSPSRAPTPTPASVYSQRSWSGGRVARSWSSSSGGLMTLSALTPASSSSGGMCITQAASPGAATSFSHSRSRSRSRSFATRLDDDDDVWLEAERMQRHGGMEDGSGWGVKRETGERRRLGCRVRLDWTMTGHIQPKAKSSQSAWQHRFARPRLSTRTRPSLTRPPLRSYARSLPCRTHIANSQSLHRRLARIAPHLRLSAHRQRLPRDYAVANARSSGIVGFTGTSSGGGPSVDRPREVSLVVLDVPESSPCCPARIPPLRDPVHPFKLHSLLFADLAHHFPTRHLRHAHDGDKQQLAEYNAASITTRQTTCWNAGMSTAGACAFASSRVSWGAGATRDRGASAVLVLRGRSEGGGGGEGTYAPLTPPQNACTTRRPRPTPQRTMAPPLPSPSSPHPCDRHRPRPPPTTSSADSKPHPDLHLAVPHPTRPALLLPRLQPVQLLRRAVEVEELDGAVAVPRHPARVHVLALAVVLSPRPSPSQTKQPSCYTRAAAAHGYPGIASTSTTSGAASTTMRRTTLWNERSTARTWHMRVVRRFGEGVDVGGGGYAGPGCGASTTAGGSTDEDEPGET
ncbi:hypothetical protein B0H12DRAFT_1246328 [Mycena haematopus]|nr:hypothetical protein B0H12DRAFT_1246328 [Mycena haematopus]